MSMSPDGYREDAALGDFIIEISERAIAEFGVERLSSFFNQNLCIAEKPFRSLDEAGKLIPLHSTAAFFHAYIAIEVLLKGVLIKGVVHGSIHKDSFAEAIVELAVDRTPLPHCRTILNKILFELALIDLKTYTRPGVAATLWQEIIDLSKIRNGISHAADVVSPQNAQWAIEVATMLFQLFTGAIAAKLGFHAHDGFRLCNDIRCSWAPEVRAMYDKVVGE